MFTKIIILIALLPMSLSLMATEVVGKIQSISVQAKVIQLINPKSKAVTVIKFNDQTKLESAESFEELTVNTKIKATVDSDMYANYIKRILVKLPEQQIIGTEQLAEMIEAGEKVFIGDARPVEQYNIGHLPNAVATPANELADHITWLPEDKNTLLVFYCGGVTCPLSPQALKIAQKNGYSNVKAYVEGFPAWKEEVYPAYVNPTWLAKNIDINHVIIDVRAKPSSHIKGAVHLPTEQLVAMHQKWNEQKLPTKKRTIFALRDRKAPITIVADSGQNEEAIEAYEILTFWNFKNVAILKGGMSDWYKQKRPIANTPIGTELHYVKKLVKGAIDETEFVAAVKFNDATIIDVRLLRSLHVSTSKMPLIYRLKRLIKI
ncbi:rhodanese-like domain-containing protein [Psychromonas sp. MME2]|uniref:rhodanese-like domain-containing protein n=1 Tax=Psychromonas sp. MME2 TaxID=3231033 RepID=UPI00339CD8C6